MRKLSIIGQRMFSIGLTGLAILCFISKDFIIGRPPRSFFIHPVLVYTAAALAIICCMSIFLQQRARAAALVIATLLLLFSISQHVSAFMNDWLNTYKTLALFGGALIIAASHMSKNNRINYFITAGTIFLAVFFIASGYAHFKFHDFVKNFIPAYIPFHAFFARFTAVCLIAGGIGILVPFTRKWAALLSGIMLLGWFLLLHIPRFLANTKDASDRMGLFESFIFAGIYFVLAAMFEKIECTHTHAR